MCRFGWQVWISANRGSHNVRHTSTRFTSQSLRSVIMFSRLSSEHRRIVFKKRSLFPCYEIWHEMNYVLLCSACDFEIFRVFLTIWSRLIIIYIYSLFVEAESACAHKFHKGCSVIKLICPLRYESSCQWCITWGRSVFATASLKYTCSSENVHVIS
jgi:hypothetical protein